MPVPAIAAPRSAVANARTASRNSPTSTPQASTAAPTSRLARCSANSSYPAVRVATNDSSVRPSSRTAAAIAESKSASVPGAAGRWWSASRVVSVSRGSTWIRVAPSFTAGRTPESKAMGWRAAGFAPTTRKAPASARSACELVIALDPSRSRIALAADSWQMRARLSTLFVPRARAIRSKR